MVDETGMMFPRFRWIRPRFAAEDGRSRGFAVKGETVPGRRQIARESALAVRVSGRPGLARRT